MSQTQVAKCDVCGKLLPNVDESKGIHTKELDFCESCKDSTRRDLKNDVKSVRAYHILIDIVAKMLAEEEKAEEEKKTTPTGTTGTNGFAPAAAEVAAAGTTH